MGDIRIREVDFSLFQGNARFGFGRLFGLGLVRPMSVGWPRSTRLLLFAARIARRLVRVV